VAAVREESLVSGKDWVGSASAVYANLAARGHSQTERAQMDYYATDPTALRRLLETGVSLNKNVWEPCAGGGHLAEVLKQNGYAVRCSDIVRRDYPCEELDFLRQNELWRGDILTNPPYKFALPITRKALETVQTGSRVVMFLKTLFLEGKERKKFFREAPPRYVYVSSSRLVCAKNGDFSSAENSAVSYAWFIFEKGFSGEPVIRWFN
jgi:hypothetical protein